MPYGLYISAEGAMAQSRRMEVIANNLANVDTTGFKRDMAIFQARYAEAIDQGIAAPGAGTVNDLGGGIQCLATVTDFGPGGVKNTGGYLDLAINGPGFFMVRKDGKDFLTRDGSFAMQPTGAVVNQNGYPVLGADGAEIVLDPSVPFRWTDDGTIEQAGSPLPLAIVEPHAAGDLVKVGENLFHSLAKPIPTPLPERKVKVGFLETSSVEATGEMMNMIETSRAYEANVNLIRNQDQLLGTLVSRLLRTS